MKKPEYTPDNMQKCICGQCPLYSECNKGKAELVFCARVKSDCEMDAKKMCICGMCKVFQENDLDGGYFCINEIREE